MRRFVLAQLFLVPFLLGGHAMAQGSGSSRTAPRRSSPSNRSNQAVPAARRPTTAAEFAASFWNYMNNAKSPYSRWGSPGKTRRQAGPGGTQSDLHHSEIGKTYLNQIANTNLQTVPLKSVFVRESYAEDGQTLKNITVMYRSKGIDPNNGDWYWIEYLPDGRLATTSPEQGNRPIAGRVQSCVECHRQAVGNDFVFLNDRPIPGARKATPRGTTQGVPRADPAGSGARR